MGWAQGVDRHGRDVGYAIKGTCDEEGCTLPIDRGLAYICGGEPDGGDHGCGYHFCYPHLYLVVTENDVVDDELPSQLCASCLAEWESAHPEPENGSEAA